jgi:quercetin dioxygenase-like cupin family protein
MQERSISGRFAAEDADEPYPGVRRWSFDSDGATVTRYEFGPGASFPIHRHEQEQITVITGGAVTFTVDGAPQPMQAGDWSVVGPGVEHGMVAGPDGVDFVAMVVPRRASRDAYEVVGS